MPLSTISIDEIITFFHIQEAHGYCEPFPEDVARHHATRCFFSGFQCRHRFVRGVGCCARVGGVGKGTVWVGVSRQRAAEVEDAGAVVQR